MSGRASIEGEIGSSMSDSLDTGGDDTSSPHCIIALPICGSGLSTVLLGRTYYSFCPTLGKCLVYTGKTSGSSSSYESSSSTEESVIVKISGLVSGTLKN